MTEGKIMDAKTLTKNRILYLDQRTQSLISSYVPKEALLGELVNFFTIFSDSTRLKMIAALSISEMCVTDLSNILDINQTTVSHQLRLLKNLGAVSSQRNGKVIYYSLKNELLSDLLLKGVEYLGY